jgi:folate-binding protein YgfZ
MLFGTIDGTPDNWKEGIDEPSETGSAACSENRCLLTIDEQRILLIDESGQTVRSSASEQDWIRQDIVNGIPAITAETQESFVPQMVNLDLIGAVNFKKGCYPGQEIVARVHYLGKVKQRMFYVSVETDQAIASGDPIYTAGQSDKAAGTVVSAVSEGGATVLLAVLQTKAVIEGASLQLGSVDGPELSLHDLPYSIPDLEG